MRNKIIGVTVGTPISPEGMRIKMNAVKTVNGIEPDENGNVKVVVPNGGASVEEAAQIQQNKENIAKLNTDKLDASKLPEAINDALEQAKASGEFNGEDGYTPVKGKDYFDGEPGYTPQKGVDYFDGEPGKTPVKGEDYFTDAEVQAIAEQAAEMVEVPSGGTMQPLTFTGAVNATYDGSVPVSVEIPQSGGGDAGGEWELLYESVIETEVGWATVSSFDMTRGEYIAVVLVPAVETQINAGYNRLMGNRAVKAHTTFAMIGGKMLHMMYAKKIAENEGMFIGYSAEKSEGFTDSWQRTAKTAIAYGIFVTNEGFNISNTIPVGTHIKIYGK